MRWNSLYLLSSFIRYLSRLKHSLIILVLLLSASIFISIHFYFQLAARPLIFISLRLVNYFLQRWLPIIQVSAKVKQWSHPSIAIRFPLLQKHFEFLRCYNSATLGECCSALPTSTSTILLIHEKLD